MGTGISKEEKKVLAEIKLSYVKDMNTYSEKIDKMNDKELKEKIEKLLTSIKNEHGIDINTQSSDDKKKILKLLYNIQQAESIKAAPKLLKGNADIYRAELSKFSKSNSGSNKPSRRDSLIKRFTLRRNRKPSSTRSDSGGKVKVIIPRGEKKTLRKKRRKKQKNKKVTRKRFI